MRRVAQLYRDRADELAAIITREMGKTDRARPSARSSSPSPSTGTTPSKARSCSGPSPWPSKTPGTAWVRKAPIGPLLGIMPWNYPYYQVARFSAPNLMIGNTIVLKHAPQCPESALAMEQIFHDAGLPDGRLHQHLRHQRADRGHDRRSADRGVSVTGSERAGTAVAPWPAST